mmetsp:Transcript_13456/g.29031  ORF Transcript_13456/g.29031 Transcript_13456/m.29031 type:complete len:244 (+) Transcript_13456:1167-1898(+)
MARKIKAVDGLAKLTIRQIPRLVPVEDVKSLDNSAEFLLAPQLEVPQGHVRLWVQMPQLNKTVLFLIQSSPCPGQVPGILKLQETSLELLPDDVVRLITIQVQSPGMRHGAKPVEQHSLDLIASPRVRISNEPLRWLPQLQEKRSCYRDSASTMHVQELEKLLVIPSPPESPQGFAEHDRAQGWQACELVRTWSTLSVRLRFFLQPLLVQDLTLGHGCGLLPALLRRHLRWVRPCRPRVHPLC